MLDQVDRVVLEELAVDLDRVGVLRDFLRWEERRALDKLGLQRDPSDLVRCQAALEQVRRCRADIDEIGEELMKEKKNG